MSWVYNGKPGSEPCSRVDMLSHCPFQTIVNPVPRLVTYDSDIGVTITSIGKKPAPMSEEMRERVLACFRDGRAVLLGSNDANVRDFMKRELIQLLIAAGVDPQFAQQPNPTQRRT